MVSFGSAVSQFMKEAKKRGTPVSFIDASSSVSTMGSYGGWTKKGLKPVKAPMKAKPLVIMPAPASTPAPAKKKRVRKALSAEQKAKNNALRRIKRCSVRQVKCQKEYAESKKMGYV